MGRDVGPDSRVKWMGSSSRSRVLSLEDSLVDLTRSATESSCCTRICSLRNLCRNDDPHVANKERNSSCKRLKVYELITISRVNQVEWIHLPGISGIGAMDIGFGKIGILRTGSGQLLHQQPIKSVGHLRAGQGSLQKEHHQRRMIERLQFQRLHQLRKIIDQLVRKDRTQPFDGRLTHLDVREARQ